MTEPKTSVARYLKPSAGFFIVALLTLTLISPLTGALNGGSFRTQPKANEGVLDLTQWRIADEVVGLNGQWEFCPNQLLDPRDFSVNLTGKSLIDLPGSWNRHAANNQKLSGDGYATYRLIFLIDRSAKLGIKVPRIHTSYKLWVNGELIASAGAVGTSQETATPQYLPQVGMFTAQQGENEIVIQVSNFSHRSGGILEGLVMGSEKQITGLRDRSIAYDALLFGCLTITGAYHLVLFLSRKKNRSPLYFGVFCLLIGMRTLLVGENFLIYLFPNFSWEVAHKLQTLTFYLGVPVILMYFSSVFPGHFEPRSINAVTGAGAAFGILVLLTPARIFTVFNPLYQAFAITVITYLLAVFARLVIGKEREIGWVIVGALALIVTSLNDIIYLSIWMKDHSFDLPRSVFRVGNLSSVGLLIFVSANSLVLARRFSNALDNEEVMTAQLKAVNLSLDELVTERTKALEESTERIKHQKVELEKANQALELLSRKDPLTGLWNRRHYDDTIRMEWNRSLRHGSPISLLMFDIDHFKEYNDYYGHKAGDECLIKVAQIADGLFERASDLVARYGGEEFIAIVPGLGADDITKMALALRKAIEGLKIPHDRSPVSPWVTVSIGVASVIPDRSQSPHELFLAVDRALYQAKSAGRNQVKFLPM